MNSGGNSMIQCFTDFMISGDNPSIFCQQSLLYILSYIYCSLDVRRIYITCCFFNVIEHFASPNADYMKKKLQDFNRKRTIWLDQQK